MEIMIHPIQTLFDCTVGTLDEKQLKSLGVRLTLASAD